MQIESDGNLIMMAFMDCTMLLNTSINKHHLFARQLPQPQPSTTSTSTAAGPISTSQCSIFGTDITHEGFQEADSSLSLLTLILGLFFPIVFTSAVITWYVLERIMNGKERAEKNGRGPPPRSTVENDMVLSRRDNHGQVNKTMGGRWKPRNGSKDDKRPEDPNKCSETGKLTPYIPIPKPFPIPWQPIFVPPLDAPDDADHDLGGVTAAAPNRRRPSAAVLSLLGKTRYLIPQLDEQIIGPKAVRQSLADWELALRASGVGGAALPRPLPAMSSKMRHAFVYCDCCELTWLVGDDRRRGVGHRLEHPWHNAYGGPDRLKKRSRSRQPDKPLGSIVVHIAAGFPYKPPKPGRNGGPAEIEARIAISFGPNSQYNLVRSFKVLNVAASKEIAELLAASHALELIATEVLTDRQAMINKHRVEKRASTMIKKDVGNDRRYAEERRDEAMGRIRDVVLRTMDRVRTTDAQMFDVERHQFDDLVREMLFPQDLGKEGDARRPITRSNIDKSLASIRRSQELIKPLLSSAEWDKILDHFLPRFEILNSRFDAYHDGLIKAAVDQLRKMACDILLRNGLKLAQVDAWCMSKGGGAGMKLRDLAILCWNFPDGEAGKGNTDKSITVKNEFGQAEAIVLTMLMCAVKESLGPMAWECHSNYVSVREFMGKIGDDPRNTQRLAVCFMRDMWLGRIKQDEVAKTGDCGGIDGSLDTKALPIISNDGKVTEAVSELQAAPSVGQTFLAQLRKGVAALTMSSPSLPPPQDNSNNAKRTCPTSPRTKEDNVVIGEPEPDGDDIQPGRAHAKKPPPRVPAVRVIMVTDSQDLVDSICKHQDDWTIHFKPGGEGAKRLASIPLVKNCHGEAVGNRMEWLRLWASVANLCVLHNVNICWYAVPRGMNADAVEMLSAAPPRKGKE